MRVCYTSQLVHICSLNTSPQFISYLNAYSAPRLLHSSQSGENTKVTTQPVTAHQFSGVFTRAHAISSLSFLPIYYSKHKARPSAF